MIVVTVEVRSAISPERNEIIGCMMLGNDGPNVAEPTKTDYSVAVANRAAARKFASHLSPLEHRLVREMRRAAVRKAEVRAYPSAAYNVWRLVSRALRAAFPEEK